ncbi:hypothetical protein R3X28_01740 [Maribacter sp. TH_r10]|uniref:hypothetical protein n=1 Tax=Maribacter sp. TH_r10 TaxID=3082086 RepID=UPI002953DB79|nr:hypothetical protein [Maribacter sp. TH_r10]MDV7137575.1 hypothetical protein [Maribacter sp. TH_r10]
MIASIFGKTKPVNHIIVVTFLFLFYWLVHFLLFKKVYAVEEILWQTVILGILLFSVLILDFIVKRNKITLANSYAILFFGLLMVLFPETLTDNNAILCNFFVLLAIRRLVSMRSLKNIRIKVFDASLWILFASLFYDWAILYLIVVYITIYIYDPKNLKNWLVPFAAFCAVLLLSSGYLVLTDNLEFFRSHYKFSILFVPEYYLNWVSSTKSIIYVLGLFVLNILTFIQLGNAGVGKIVTTRIIVFFLIIGLVIDVLVYSNGQYPIILTFFPTAVLMTNYIELLKREKFREIALIFSVTIPFIVFLSTMFL